MTAAHLKVAVVTPVSEELCAFIESCEPRLELVRNHTLLPPERWPGDYAGDPAFHRTAEQQRAFEALAGDADALYGIPDTSSAALARAVRANPRLRWVQAMAAGSGAQVKAAGLSQDELSRVVFTTSAGVHAGPLSEFALFGLLAGAKRLPRLQAMQRERAWPDRLALGQIAAQTIAVIGLGHIGREVARKVKTLGAHVIGVNKTVREVEGVDESLGIGQLADTVSRADGIVVTLPGTDATRHLVSADVLARIRPGATFVSIGRGSVIDESALVAALQDGRVGFAALDVFEVEPLPAQSPLWNMPNVVISPHTAASSPREPRLIAELFCDNASRFIEGRPLRNVVDTVQFY